MAVRKPSGSFLLCLGVNMALNLSGSIPAWICLALHFLLELPLWWFVAALGLWIAGLILSMAFMGWASKAGSKKDPPKVNKNPYSVKSSTSIPQNRKE